MRLALIIITTSNLFLSSCNSDDTNVHTNAAEPITYKYQSLLNYAEINEGMPINFLGVRVGKIGAISFISKGKDATIKCIIEFSKNDIVNEFSYLFLEKDHISLINPDMQGDLLKEGSTIPFIGETEKNIITQQIEFQSNPVNNELSNSEQLKLDTLKEKINKLNQLIEEVNGEN